MRWLALLLLLANAAYFGWEFTRPQVEPAAAPAAAAPDRGPRLVTLSERRVASPQEPAQTHERGTERAAGGPPASEPEEGAAPRAVTAASLPEQPAKAPEEPKSEAEPRPVPPTFCFRVSGIAEVRDAEVTAAGVQQAGATVYARGAEQIPVSNYWVMLPPAGKNAVQRARLALERARLDDFYVVKSGDYTNAISLGVFSTREAAERRVTQVSGLNSIPAQPRIEPLKLTAKRQWLAMRWAESPPADWSATLLEKPGVSVEPVDCPGR